MVLSNVPHQYAVTAHRAWFWATRLATDWKDAGGQTSFLLTFLLVRYSTTLWVIYGTMQSL